MTKKDWIATYELLFQEQVMVARKDVHMPKHPELADKDVPNFHIMKAMQSYITWLQEGQLAWRHSYWYLSNKGTQYFCD
ncbi:40S ribosomal protein S10 [Camelus dromedarius]|uniref:40S ribosomal protein S10 n=1 Tax=Camelus dromedarius TaxID=9838 RepID=A0A5N4EL62_CAMDR|nr:40S ribosomal protein S10 [Camelus dromedarius]